MSEYIIECEYDSDEGWIPGEHREEIVRCRDCKRFHTNTNGFDCPKLEPDGFCAWGTRRADE